MVKNFFRSPPPLKDVVFKSIGKLKFQQIKLEQVTVRLRERDKVLFGKCVAAVKGKNRERAIICANELTEVRKLLNMLAQTQLAIERIILRLETIRELSGIMVDLLPALRNLKSLTERLVGVMPEMARELENVNDSISETLAITRISSMQPVTPIEVKTPAGEEILKEASAFLEERLTEKLPEPPAPIIAKEKVESKREMRQMVALTASCQVHKPERKPQEYFSYKDLKMQSVSLTIKQSSSLENALLDYVKKSKGEIDAVQCANELNVPFNDVVETLEKLGQEGKIKIQQ
ncbi:MAG: Snf7 family protein [Candidatus Bathyarchaeia archaeon]